MLAALMLNLRWSTLSRASGQLRSVHLLRTTSLARTEILISVSYRFRLVSISCDLNFTFSIDEHEMTVIEVDGTNGRMTPHPPIYLSFQCRSAAASSPSDQDCQQVAGQDRFPHHPRSARRQCTSADRQAHARHCPYPL
jgi:hypothetical protein